MPYFRALKRALEVRHFPFTHYEMRRLSRTSHTESVLTPSFTIERPTSPPTSRPVAESTSNPLHRNDCVDHLQHRGERIRHQHPLGTDGAITTAQILVEGHFVLSTDTESEVVGGCATGQPARANALSLKDIVAFASRDSQRIANHYHSCIYPNIHAERISDVFARMRTPNLLKHPGYRRCPALARCTQHTRQAPNPLDLNQGAANTKAYPRP